MEFYPFDLNKLLFNDRYRSCWNCKVFDRLLNGIICGMRFLHRSGLIHRDLNLTTCWLQIVSNQRLLILESRFVNTSMTALISPRVVSRKFYPWHLILSFLDSKFEREARESHFHHSLTHDTHMYRLHNSEHQHSNTNTGTQLKESREHHFIWPPRSYRFPRSKTIAVQFLHRCVEFQYYIVGNDITHKGIQQGEARTRRGEKSFVWLSSTDETCSETWGNGRSSTYCVHVEEHVRGKVWLWLRAEEIANLIGRCWNHDTDRRPSFDEIYEFWNFHRDRLTKHRFRESGAWWFKTPPPSPATPTPEGKPPLHPRTARKEEGHG